MGKKSAQEVISGLLTSNNDKVLKQVQLVMNEQKVSPWEARNLLYLDAMNFLQVNKAVPPVKTLYTGERKKYYPIFKEKEKEFVSKPLLFDQTESYKEEFEKKTGQKINLYTQYDVSTGKIITRKPILKATHDWNNDAGITNYLFGDDSEYAYDKDLTIKAYNELGFVKGGKYTDYNGIIKQLEANPKMKFLVEEKRAELHSRNYETKKLKDKYDMGQPNEQVMEVLKWMNGSVLTRGVFKLVEGVATNDQRGQLAKELKQFNNADFGEMELKKQIGKNNTFKADKITMSEDLKKDRVVQDVLNIGIQGLLSSMEFLVGVGLVSKVAKGITWASKLSKVPKMIGKPIEYALKPISWVEAKTYGDLGLKTVAKGNLGSRALQQLAIFPPKLLGAFETSAIYFGAINQGVNKYYNPHLRNSDPNISSFQQGLRDVVEGGVEGLTEQLVFFPKLNITGKALTKTAARNTLDLAIGVISENLEEEVSRIVSDYFDLQYKGTWGGTSFTGDILKGDQITQEQVNEVLGVTLSTVALMGVFGTASKVAEKSYKKDMIKTVEDLVKKHISYDKITQVLNDSFKGDPREKFIMRQAMEESQILQQAFRIGLEDANVDQTGDLIVNALKSGFNQLSEKESLSFLKNMDDKAVESIRDNLIKDVAKEVPALKSLQKKFKDPKVLSYLVGNILQGNELTEEKIKKDLASLPEVDQIYSVYKEATNNILSKEKKSQIELIEEEIETVDQSLSSLKMMPEESWKKASIEKKLKEKEELVKAKNILMQDGLVLKDAVDPLLVFAKYSANKNRAFVNEKNINENLWNKAQEILQIATPYSGKIDTAVEYLEAIKKNYEQRIKSGELLGQRESLIYKQAVAELNKYNYYEYEKYQLPQREQYDILDTEREFYKANPEEYAKTKQLYLGSILRAKFNGTPSMEEWQKAHDEFIGFMDSSAKNGKNTEDALREFFGDRYSEELQQMADYLIRLHKAVHGSDKSTKKTIERKPTTQKTESKGIVFNKNKKNPNEIPLPPSNPLGAFSENESGKWYQFYRTDLSKSLFLLREPIVLSEAVKKAILEYANDTVSDPVKWIEFKKKFIEAYENNQPLEQDILDQYEYALPFFVIYDYLRKVVDVKAQGKYYTTTSVESTSVSGPSSIYTQVWSKISYFSQIGKITNKQGNVIDPASLQRDAEQLKPVETMQKLVDKNAPLKEESAEEIKSQNDLVDSFGNDIKQYHDFQKKYPNNLWVKKILFVHAIAKGKTPVGFEGVITESEVKDILTKFEFTVKEKLKVYLKGSIVANGNLTDDIDNVPFVEKETEQEEIKKELLKKLPKKITNQQEIELLTRLTANRYVGVKAQEILDKFKKETELEIKDTPFKSPNVLESLYLEVGKMKNAPIFKSVMKEIIVNGKYDMGMFKSVPINSENLKEIREFISKLAHAFINEDSVNTPMEEHKNNIKFIYYSLLKSVQETNPELLHEVELNGEYLYLVKEVEGFDKIVKATVDKNGKVILRRALEAPTEPVVTRTTDKGTETLPQNNQHIVEARQKLNKLMEEFYTQNKQNFYDVLMYEAALASSKFESALTVGANKLVGHGMAKSGVGALKDLFKLFDQGIDLNRNYGVGLYAAPLVLAEEQKGIGAGIGTGDGTAYRDGVFILVAKNATTSITKIEDIGGILVNPAFASQQGALEFLRVAFPNLVIESYSNVTEFVQQIKLQNISTNLMVTRTVEEGTETPSQEKKVAEKLKFDLYQPDGFKKEGDVFEVTFFEGQDVGELTLQEQAKTNKTILQNIFQALPNKVAEYLNNFTSEGPDGIEVVEKGEVRKIDGKIVITKPIKIKFVGGFTVNEETPSISPTEPQGGMISEETTQSTTEEEIVPQREFVEREEIATEEFSNKELEESIRQQYYYRYFARRTKTSTTINYDIKTGSYYITVPFNEHFDLGKLKGEKKQELFGFLISRIRINNTLYLEDDISKRLMLQKELINTIEDISKLDLSEEEFSLFKRIIHSGRDLQKLDPEAYRQLEFIDGITLQNEKIDVEAVKVISRNLLPKEDGKRSDLPVPEIYTLSLKDIPSTNNLLYQGLYEQNGEIIKVLSSVRQIAIHEYIHYLFDHFDVKNNEDFKAIDKVAKDYLDEVISYWKQGDYVNLAKMFDNVNLDYAIKIAKRLINSVDLSTVSYANKSATERVANLFSNPYFTDLMLLRRHEGKTLMEPYFQKIMLTTIKEDLVESLVKEYLATFEIALRLKYQPNVGSDDNEIVEIETPKIDFEDDVDLGIDPYGGFMSTKVRPELADWSINQQITDFSTFNEEEADLIANSMKDLNEDFRIATGVTASGTIFDFVEGITFDEFYDLIKKPSEALKETEPDVYEARMNLFNKFTKVLNNKFGHSSHIDYGMFDNSDLMSQEKYVKRLLHDVFNKLNSVSYHQIFQIIAKPSKEFDGMDFVVKPLQKGKNADGETISNYRPNMLILEKQDDFIAILNKIAGTNLITSIKFKFLIDVLGKHLGEALDPEYRQFISSNMEREGNFSSQMMKTISLIHQTDGGIFLNKFGDKNHNPVMYLNFSKKAVAKINEEQTKDHTYSPMEAFYTIVALPVYKKYRKMGIEDLKAMGVENPESLFLYDEEIKQYNPLVVTLAMRALLEEMKKGATAENFNVNGKDIQVSTFLRNENMITLMKRSTLVLEKMKMTVSQNSLKNMGIEKRTDVVPYELVKDNKTMPSVVHNGEQIFFKVAFVSTKNMPKELETLFRNKYGTFRFDGASFVVRRKFDKIYSEIFGVLNEGTAKNHILPKNAFIKHAVHAISASDPIGQWMLANNVAMLVFDEGEKNKVLRDQGTSLVKNIDTGESVPNNAGFASNRLEDVFNIDGSIKLSNEYVSFNTYYLDMNDISRIGEKYSNDKDVKALQQILNSSGMTLANEALGNEGLKLITLMSKFTRSFAQELNKFIKNIDENGELRTRENPENYAELIGIVVKHLYRMAKSPTGSLTSNFAEVFPEIVYAYEAKNKNKERQFSDVQIYEYMKQFSYMPLVVEAMDNFMNEIMSPSVSYETRGQSLPATPDLGKLSPTRMMEMTKSYARALEYDMREGAINELLRERRDEFLAEALSMIPSTDPDRITKAKDIANKRNEELIQWYDKIVSNGNTEEGSLEKRKYDIIAKTLEESQKWYKEVTDENQFLKRDYCYITASTAKKLKLKVGDKVLVTIIPSAGLMEAKGLIIAGILNENGSASPGSIVVNHDWFQGIGRDYDIDVLNLVVKPSIYTQEEWDFIVEEYKEIEKRYVNQTYKIFKETLGEEYIDKQLSKYDKEYLDKMTEFDKKMLIAFNDRVFTDYQRKFLGSQDNFKSYYSVVENATLYLGDHFFKDVGYVIVLRTLHQYLASVRMSFTLSYLNEKGEREKKTVDFGNKEVWNKVHLSLMIGTQHQVDYPKTTSKDEYDFRPESYFAKMLGFDQPYKDLPQDLQRQIDEIYIVFRNNLAGLRVPSYKRMERDGQELTKFESATVKLEEYSKLKDTLKKQLSKKGVESVSFNEVNPANPYISYVETINLDRLQSLSTALKYPSIDELHTYSKVIEYKILGKFLTDLEFPVLDPDSLPYIEKNLKLVAQFFYQIVGADKDGNPIIRENQDKFNDQQNVPKLLNELRNKGYASSIHYPQYLTSKSIVNPKFLPNLQEGSLILFVKHNLQSQEEYENAISYTQAMFFEGVKSTTHSALTEGYKLLRKRVESKYKRFDDKALRSYLAEIYGLPKYPFEQLSESQLNEMFEPEVLRDKDKLIKKFNEKKDKRKKTGFEETSGGNYYNYVVNLLGMTETPTERKFQSMPKAEQYIFDYFITTDDLFVNGFIKGLMTTGINGTMDPIVSTAQKVTTEFTKKRQKDIYEVAKIIMIMNQVILQKDVVTSENVIETRNAVAQRIGVTKLNPYYWIEIGKKVIADFGKEPKSEMIQERSKMRLRVDKDSYIEIDFKDSTRVYKLTGVEKPEEVIGELTPDSVIYKLLTSKAFWENEYHYANKMEVKKYFDLMNKDTFGLDERKQVLNKILEQYMLEEGIAFRDETGQVIPNEDAKRYLATALKWMVGFNELNEMSNTLYQSGVNIDNRILLSLMQRWSPLTAFQYKKEYARLQGINRKEYLDQMNYSLSDFYINENKKPRRSALEDYWDHKRKSHHYEVYSKENKEGGYMYTTPLRSKLLLPKNFDTLNSEEDIESLKEQIIELAMDVNTLRVTAINDNPLQFISTFSDIEKIDNWIDNSFENIEEHIRNAKVIETLKAIYVDLQLIKQSYDYDMIRERDYDKDGNSKVSDQTDFLTWIARGNERLDFTIHDDFKDDRMRLVARTVRFDGRLEFEEWTEEEKRMQEFIDRTERKDYSKVKPEERIKEKEVAYEYKQELQRRKRIKTDKAVFDFFLIDPMTAFTLSQGVNPFNKEYTGLRPFGLMSLNYAKMRLLVGDLNVATQKIKGLVKEITNLIPFPEINRQISQSMEERVAFDANVYEMADKILGKQVSFEVKESEKGFQVTIEDKTFYQNKANDTVWLNEIAKKLELPVDDYTLAVLYSSIKMRSLFDYHLKFYISRMNFYFDFLTKKELADDATIFRNEIEHIRQKYYNIWKNFQRYRKIGENVYTEKVTPKVFLSTEVLNTYAQQRYTSRLRYYTDHMEEFTEEEQARIKGMTVEDVKAELQSEIENRVGGSTFYVPLFSYMRDNDLGNYFPSLEMMEEHIFGTLFKMIESDMATVYYYQSKIYSMRNATPEFDNYHLDRWFRQFSDPLNLKNMAMPVNMLQKDDFVFFYTYQYNELGEQTTVIRSGKVAEVTNTGFELIGYEGERVAYSDDEVFVSDFTALNVKVDRMVYKPKTLDYWTELEKRILYNQASLSDMAQYYALKGMSELFVSTQMLTIGSFRTYLVNKMGGNVNMLTLAGYKVMPSEFSAAMQGKIPKMQISNQPEFDRFLSMANSMSGLQPLDVTIGSATALGMDLPVFTKGLKDNIAFLAKVLKKNTQEYDGVSKLKEEIFRLIDEINEQVSKGEITVSEAQDARKELMDIFRSVAYNVNLNIFSIEGIPEELSEEDQQRLIELMNEVVDNPQKTANLYGLNLEQINKALKSFRWRGLKRYGSEKAKAPEEQLRTSSFHIGYKMALDNGATPEEAVVWGLRFTDQSQVVYDRFARKIGTDNIWKGFIYLMSNYAHQQQMNLKMMLDEIAYDKLTGFLKSNFDFTFDSYKLINEEIIPYDQVQRITSQGEFTAMVKKKLFRKKDFKGLKVDANIGVNTLNRLIKLIKVTSVLDYMNRFVLGLRSIQSPVIAPLLAMVQLLIAYIDDPEDVSLKDFLWTFNMLLGMKYGVGMGMILNATSSTILSAVDNENLIYGLWSGIISPAMSTRIGSIARGYNNIDFRVQSWTEGLVTGVNLISPITGLGVNANEIKKIPLFANLGEEMAWWEKFFLVTLDGLMIPFPAGVDAVRLLYDLPEYDKGLDKIKKYQRRQEWLEKNK